MFNAKAAPPSRLSLEPQFVIRSWHELRAKQLQWMLYIHHKHLQYQQRKKARQTKVETRWLAIQMLCVARRSPLSSRYSVQAAPTPNQMITLTAEPLNMTIQTSILPCYAAIQRRYHASMGNQLFERTPTHGMWLQSTCHHQQPSKSERLIAPCRRIVLGAPNHLGLHLAWALEREH